MAGTRKLTVVHTGTVKRQVTIEIPDDAEVDDDQWFYENCGEEDGEIVGGGWEIDSIEDEDDEGK